MFVPSRNQIMKMRASPLRINGTFCLENILSGLDSEKSKFVFMADISDWTGKYGWSDVSLVLKRKSQLWLI